MGNGTGARTSGVTVTAGPRVTGGRTGNIVGMLGPGLPVDVPPAWCECWGQGLDPRAGTPRKGDQPQNWRATVPRTGGHHPKNWTGTSLLFNLDRSLLYFRLGSYPGVGTDHSGVVLRGLCFPSLLCGYAGLVEQVHISVKLPVPTGFFVLRTQVCCGFALAPVIVVRCTPSPGTSSRLRSTLFPSFPFLPCHSYTLVAYLCESVSRDAVSRTRVHRWCFTLVYPKPQPFDTSPPLTFAHFVRSWSCFSFRPPGARGSSWTWSMIV